MYEKLQEYLLRGGVCLLNFYDEVSVIIHHNDYFVVVDCGTRDMFGLASNIGTPVVVFNTCLNDLMVHTSNLKKALDAQWYAICSISVKAGQEDPDIQSGTEFTDYVYTEGDAKVDNTSSVRFERENNGTEVVCELEDSISVRVENHVSGSFHQGYKQFKYG